MVKFGLKLLIFAAAFLLYDKVFNVIADISADAEVDNRLELVLKGEMNRDIIVFGSSTGSRDIIASQIEKKTGYSSYNLCYPGSDVTFHEFVLQTLLKFNQKPKMAVLAVDDNAELLYDKTIIFRKDRLYPLVKYPYIAEKLAELDNRPPLLSKILVLDRLNKYNFDLRKKKFTPMDSIMSCGSMPISWKPQDMPFGYVYDDSDRPYNIQRELPEKVAAFKNIIDLCNDSGIKVVIAFPPLFKKQSTGFKNRIMQLAGNNVFYYVYDTGNPVYVDDSYYSDDSHLMKNGAIIFTDELIEYINDIMSNQ